MLTLNHFEFDRGFYTQKTWVAMDTTMGGDYTCRYTGHKEHLFHSSYDRPTLKLYKGYINDGVGASTKP